MTSTFIRIDPQDKALFEAALKPGIYKRAMKRGINKTARAGRTTLSKTIRKSFFVKAGAVKRSIRTTLAINNDLSATIELAPQRHKGVPLSQFSANKVNVGRGKGVSVKIRRDKPREIVDKNSKYSKYGFGAFKTKSGRVLERRSKRRMDLSTPVGPTVLEMAAEVGAVGKTERDIERKLGPNIEREVAFEIQRRTGS